MVYKAISISNEIGLPDLLGRKDILNDLIAQFSVRNKDEQVTIQGKKL